MIISRQHKYITSLTSHAYHIACNITQRHVTLHTCILCEVQQTATEKSNRDTNTEEINLEQNIHEHGLHISASLIE